MEVSQRKNRFKDLPWFEPIAAINERGNRHCRTMIIGAGGIGSWLAIALSRAGLTVDVIDYDIIEEHNLGGQAFMAHNVGQPKVDAVKEVCVLFNGNRELDLLTYNDRIDNSYTVPLVTFCCPDNMAARKYCFDRWVDSCESVTSNDMEEEDHAIFIDGRMLAEDGQVYAVRFNPAEIRAYRETLFEDSEVKDQMCTAKATSHCGMMISSLMASVFFNHVTNWKMGYELREVPFKTEFHLQMMDFRVSSVNKDATEEQSTVIHDGSTEIPLELHREPHIEEPVWDFLSQEDRDDPDL